MCVAGVAAVVAEDQALVGLKVHDVLNFELCAFDQGDLFFRQAVEVIDEAVDLRVRGGNLAVQRGLLVRGFYGRALLL